MQVMAVVAVGPPSLRSCRSPAVGLPPKVSNEICLFVFMLVEVAWEREGESCMRWGPPLRGGRLAEGAAVGNEVQHDLFQEEDFAALPLLRVTWLLGARWIVEGAREREN